MRRVCGGGGQGRLQDLRHNDASASTDATSTLINENYSETAAAFLREPRLAEELVAYLRSVEGDLANHAIVKNIAEAMDKIGKCIDVPIHTTVPADKVQEMATAATKAVQACVELAK